MCTVVDRSLDFTQSKDPSSDFISNMLAKSYRELRYVRHGKMTQRQKSGAQHREKDRNKADTTATKTSPINAE